MRSRFSREFYLTILAVLVVGAIGLAVLSVLGRPPSDLLYIPRPARLTPEIELLREYIRIDTSNPPGNELAGAEFLARELREAGIEAEIIESAPGRANLHARIPGRRRGEGLLLLHHIDVVPAGPEGWTVPPFAADVKRNMVWGRGALDMKSIGIAHLVAFTELARSGRVPERDLVLLATADEEAGGHLGMGWLIRNRPDVIEGVRYAITEGGITETIANRINYFGIEVGSMLSITLTARSDRREELEHLRIDLEPWFHVSRPERFLPGVLEYFESVAAHRTEMPELIADVPAAVDKGLFWKLHAKYRDLTGTSVAAGSIRQAAGGGFEMIVVIRHLPDEEPARPLAWFHRRFAREGVELEVRSTMEPAPFSSTSTPFFEEIERAVTATYGEVAVGPIVMRDITTDSRYLRSRGLDSYGFWPFPVDFFQTLGIHGHDERIRLDWFMEGVEMTRRLVEAWCLPPAPSGAP
ncbi:MAG TPA: M20/M25/M40 family metallo-hydrolase [Thermoanaerobaculia bacterium]|nr:M20/M25/M40 family metallo-hydrolase [Thermoanaerobaculia bacterium]